MKSTLAYSPGKHYKWLITILSGLFMFLSLYVYRAYHIDQAAAFTGHNMLFRALTHSAIISLAFYLMEFQVGPRLPIHSKWKPVVTTLSAIFIGLNGTFLAFNYFFHWTEMQWLSYSKFLYEYPLILIIPFTLSFLIDQLMQHRKTEPGQLITIISENKKDQFQVKPEHLLFIKSADNYIEIYFRSNGGVDKQLIRKSLKEVDAAFRDSGILVRCHRSYLINPANIEQVHKSTGKMELTISGITIPVSKKYADGLSDKYLKMFIPHMEISPQTA